MISDHSHQLFGRRLLARRPRSLALSQVQIQSRLSTWLLSSSKFSSTVWGPRTRSSLSGYVDGEADSKISRQTESLPRSRRTATWSLQSGRCCLSMPMVKPVRRWHTEQGQQAQASASASWVVRFLVSCRRSTTVAAELCCRPCAVAAAVKYNIKDFAASNKKWTVYELAVQNFLMGHRFSTS